MERLHGTPRSECSQGSKAAPNNTNMHSNCLAGISRFTGVALLPHTISWGTGAEGQGPGNRDEGQCRGMGPRDGAEG